MQPNLSNHESFRDKNKDHAKSNCNAFIATYPMRRPSDLRARYQENTIKNATQGHLRVKESIFPCTTTNKQLDKPRYNKNPLTNNT